MAAPLFVPGTESPGFFRTISPVEALEVGAIVAYWVGGLILVAYMSLITLRGGKSMKPKKSKKGKQTAKEKLDCWCQWNYKFWENCADMLTRKWLARGNGANPLINDKSPSWMKDVEA